jgi:hypothetical protein
MSFEIDKLLVTYSSKLEVESIRSIQCGMKFPVPGMFSCVSRRSSGEGF